MIYQTITYEVRDDIATLTLNRPEVMNALNTQMRAEITHAAKAAEREARVLVLTGAGRAFCSGQDLGDGGSAANLDLERTLRDEYVPMLRAIFDNAIPTISAVNGAAAGAGANLALAADVVIATESAKFIQAFTRIGLIPDAGGTYFLPRQMGVAKGDQLVRVFVEIPKKLDERQKELLREFDSIESEKSGQKSFFEKISDYFHFS